MSSERGQPTEQAPGELVTFWHHHQPTAKKLIAFPGRRVIIGPGIGLDVRLTDTVIVYALC